MLRSPQAVANSATLDRIEDALGSVIAQIVAANASTYGFSHAPDGDINAGTPLTQRTMTLTPALSKLDAPIGVVLRNIVLPILKDRIEEFVRGDVLIAAAPVEQENPTLALAIEASLMNAYGAASDSLHNFGLERQDTSRFYAMHDNDPDRTEVQRQSETYANRMIRWITRSALFETEEQLSKELGYTHKRWVSMHDAKVRHEHNEIDGVSVPLDGTFETSTGSIKFPGDPAAPIHLVANCRCVLEFVTR